MEGVTVEVKIGITDSPRELVLASTQTPAEVEELVSAALSDGSGLLRLSDERGRRFLIHATRIAYVEIGVADARRVGFGISAESGKHAGKGR
ncbi:ATP-binding protein [Mycobacterium sp. 852002-40037_SCH5390672]|nr:ATP-binding protein [Mycobacterium sp. 852002-40037_SCH5390672]